MYLSFAILPDGSKDGWDTSMASDELRGHVIEQLSVIEYGVDYVEVVFGHENETARVTRHNSDRSSDT